MARLQKRGHVILAVDGLQTDVGYEVLLVIRDCLSQEILRVDRRQGCSIDSFSFAT